MSFNVQDWYKALNEGDVVFSFKGDITSELITNVLEVIESKLDDTPERAKVRKKVYNVMVECLQNLFHHGIKDVTNENNSDKHFGIFVIKRIEFGYKLFSGNFVSNSRIQYLTDRLEQINSMSKEELKSLYKLILNNQEFSNKGGGGLGMIDIARKTESKFHYNFYKINDEFSFYNLNIDVE